MTGLTYKLTGKDKALAALGRVVARATNPKDLFDTIGASLVASTQRRFDTGIGSDGSPWPVSIRAAMTGGKTLFDSGRLAKSIIHNATNASLEVGTDSIYAAVHQFGAIIRPVAAKALRFKIGNRWVTTRKVEIPARPFLGLDDDDKKEIVLVADDWLKAVTP